MFWKILIFICCLSNRLLKNPLKYLPYFQSFSASEKIISMAEHMDFRIYINPQIVLEKISLKNSCPERFILYLHGGAFLMGLNNFYRKFAVLIAEKLNASVILVDYDLAPQYPFPQAFNQCFQAYQSLLAQGIDPSKIIIAGDSAGGNLTAAILLKIKDEKLPMPKGACILSGWFDLTVDCMRSKVPFYQDPIISLRHLPLAIQAYAGAAYTDNSYISPLKGDLSHFPPLFLLVGEGEALKDDTVNFATKAQTAGVNVTLLIEKKMMHIHPIFFPDDPKSAEIIAKMTRFIEELT